MGGFIESKGKSVFIIYDSNEAKVFSECLKKHGLENEIGDYLGRKLIDWLNTYNEPRPLGYLSIMYCNLPRTRRGDSCWEMLDTENYCPEDIKAFCHRLKQYTGYNIAIKYNGADNAVEVMLEADFKRYSGVIEECQHFNKLMDGKTPFISVTYCAKDGKLIQEEAKEKNDKNGMNSYLYSSLFFTGLAYPEGNNISPKTNDETNIEITGHKAGRTGNWVREFNVGSITQENELKRIIKGNFVAEVSKIYNHYWDAVNKKQTNMRKHEPFKMIDNGEFQTKINIESPTELTIDTQVNVVRNFVGHNYDGLTIRDAYFGNNNHDDSRFSISIREYFKMISNNRMLHYSDYSDAVELYNLPAGHKITDGLIREIVGYSNVYHSTNINKLEKDDDYALIKGIVDAGIEKGKVRVLVPKNPQ